MGGSPARVSETADSGTRRAATGRSPIGPAVRARVRAFVAFWYDFVVGDDWLVAVGVLVALVVTYALSRTAVAAWWLMPVAVAGLLPISIRRLVRRR
jgi:hypothetical protein